MAGAPGEHEEVPYFVVTVPFARSFDFGVECEEYDAERVCRPTGEQERKSLV